ncbi:glutaredoxin family protein [Bacillus seohaeanensis]|jgi:glutaredoxin|uniref:Glutaredoxin family protein n=1 Tax=Bacillus seohaeanensis TaxID=284580 RepID=A0ABW5RQF8_9BACI
MKVYVYSTDTCRFCTMLKNWLIENRVTFIEKDIVNDSQALHEFNKFQERATPLIIFKNESEEIIKKIVGFNKGELTKELSIQE